MNAIYTEAAEVELEKFKYLQQKALEEAIRERKILIGDDVLEITASDIKEASRRLGYARDSIYGGMRYGKFTTTAQAMMPVVTKLYMFIGAITMLAAIFQEPIQALFENNRTQAVTFLVGAAMLLIGFGLNLLLKATRGSLPRLLMGATYDDHLVKRGRHPLAKPEDYDKDLVD